MSLGENSLVADYQGKYREKSTIKNEGGDNNTNVKIAFPFSSLNVYSTFNVNFIYTLPQRPFRTFKKRFFQKFDERFPLAILKRRIKAIPTLKLKFQFWYITFM